MLRRDNSLPEARSTISRQCPKLASDVVCPISSTSQLKAISLTRNLSRIILFFEGGVATCILADVDP